MKKIKDLGNFMREIGLDAKDTSGSNCLTEEEIQGIIDRRAGVNSPYRDSLKSKQEYVEKHIAECSHCLRVLDDSIKLERYC